MKLLELNEPPGPEVKIPPGSIVVTQGFSSANVIDLSAVRGARNVVQRDNICYDQELALAQDLQTKPDDFFADPLKSILRALPNPDSLLSLRINSQTSKREVLDKLQEFLEANSKSRSVREEAMSAADEIFTNASKNSGKFYKATADGQAVEGSIEFTAYLDSDRLTIVCVDTYGLLKVEPLLARIQHVFKVGMAGAIQPGNAGAGIGSFMIFNSCSSYYLGVDAGKKTVVGCSFQVSPRTKDKTGLSKNIHCISIGHQG